MTDLSLTIAPKSDQLNADDLISGPRTVRITKVSASGTSEQPIDVYFEGDGGKPFKPCKSMRRVLVHVWGRDGNSYVGRAMTLYRDPKVRFGGIEVGGIRISHMSDIDAPVTMALTETRASRKPFQVKPLAADAVKADPATKWADAYIAKLGTLATTEAVEAFATSKAGKLEELKAARPDLHARVEIALAQRREQLTGGGFDDDLSEGPADEQRGEQSKLDEAKDAITRAELVADVNNLVRSYREELSEAEFDQLTAHGTARIAELKAVK